MTKNPESRRPSPELLVNRKTAVVIVECMPPEAILRRAYQIPDLIASGLVRRREQTVTGKRKESHLVRCFCLATKRCTNLAPSFL